KNYFAIFAFLCLTFSISAFAQSKVICAEGNVEYLNSQIAELEAKGNTVIVSAPSTSISHNNYYKSDRTCVTVTYQKSLSSPPPYQAQDVGSSSR
ncbi:MAG: hypothetical protein ABIQ95_04530, partial [Bdellovibrionia bacterium]